MLAADKTDAEETVVNGFHILEVITFYVKRSLDSLAAVVRYVTYRASVSSEN